jgi:hypothetical protein
MKKLILFTFLLVSLPFFLLAQSQDDKSYDPTQDIQSQLMEMMEKMTEQLGGSGFQMDTTFFRGFEDFNPEDLGLGDIQFYMDTLMMEGFSDGDDWIEINPENNDLNFSEMLERMNKHMEQYGNSFNLEELMEGFEMSPAIPAPDQFQENSPLDESGKPIKKKKKRKTYSL